MLNNFFLGCGQPIFCLADYNITGKPDGLAIDWNDDLWIAAPFSGLVRKLSGLYSKQMFVSGKLKQRIDT